MKYTYVLLGTIKTDTLFTNEALRKILMNMLNEKADFDRADYDKYLSSKREIFLGIQRKGG